MRTEMNHQQTFTGAELLLNWRLCSHGIVINADGNLRYPDSLAVPNRAINAGRICRFA